jgi:serine O-acetyltransferase
MGVVIGETAQIGNNVTLYQGVTLGGTGKEKGKRHPTIGNNVVIATGAKVLGSFTVGENVKIGAGSVVLDSVAPNCTVVGVPGRVVALNGRKLTADASIDLQHHLLPDPVADLINNLQQRIEFLEKKFEKVEDKQDEFKDVQYPNPSKRGIHLA